MIAILERDFLSFAKLKKFFVLRSLIVLLPLLVAGAIGSQMGGSSGDAIGGTIFWSSVVIQSVFFFFVSPGLFSSVLAEERNNRKLDVLRSTPLSVGAIVFAKWIARMGLMTSIFLAGLPLTASALIFGGVMPKHFTDAAMILYGTILWTGAIAFVISARNRDIGRAARSAYAWVIAWALIHNGLVGAVGVMQSQSVRGGATAAGFGTNLLATVVMTSPVGVWTLAGRSRLPMPFGIKPLIPVAYAPLAYLVLSALFAGVAILLAARVLAKDADPAYSSGRRKRRESADGADETQAAPSAAALAGTFLSAPSILWRNPLHWLESLHGARKAALRRRIVALVGVLAGEGLWIYWFFEARRFSISPYGSREFVAFHIAAFAVLFLVATILVLSGAASIVHRDLDARTEEVLFSTPAESRAMCRAKIFGVFRPLRFVLLLLVVHAVVALFDSFDYLLSVTLSLGAVAMLLFFFNACAMRLAFRAGSMRKALVRVFVFAIIFTMILPGASGLLLMMAQPRDESVLFLFFGYHPAFLIVTPLVSGADGGFHVSQQDGFPFVLLWIFAYIAFLFHSYRTSLPKLFDDRREDRLQERFS